MLQTNRRGFHPARTRHHADGLAQSRQCWRDRWRCRRPASISPYRVARSIPRKPNPDRDRSRQYAILALPVRNRILATSRARILRRSFKMSESVWPDGTNRFGSCCGPVPRFDAILLANTFPNMAAVSEQLRGHTEIPVVATDQENVLLAEKNYRLVDSCDLDAGCDREIPAAFRRHRRGRSPRWRISIGGCLPVSQGLLLCFLRAAKKKRSRERFIAFLRSAEGEQLLRENRQPGAPAVSKPVSMHINTSIPSLRQTVNGIALAVAIITALAGPLGYAFGRIRE